MMLYRNTKVNVRSPDGDTDYFDIVAGVPQRDTLADDIALLANTPTQAESLLHGLERAAAGIGLHFNADKTEYMRWHLHTKR